MTLRKLTARFSGTCDACGETVAIGDKILWAKGETYHDSGACRPGATDRDHEEDDGEDRAERALARRDEAEYRQGIADGRRYSEDRKTYGHELAERWEMEEEMKHAWDY